MTCLNRDPPELRRDVMLSQTNAHRLAITNLGHVGAHIRCLRIIMLGCLNGRMAKQELNLFKFAPGQVTESCARAT